MVDYTIEIIDNQQKMVNLLRALVSTSAFVIDEAG